MTAPRPSTAFTRFMADHNQPLDNWTELPGHFSEHSLNTHKHSLHFKQDMFVTRSLDKLEISNGGLRATCIRHNWLHELPAREVLYFEWDTLGWISLESDYNRAKLSCAIFDIRFAGSIPIEHWKIYSLLVPHMLLAYLVVYDKPPVLRTPFPPHYVSAFRLGELIGEDGYISNKAIEKARSFRDELISQDTLSSNSDSVPVSNTAPQPEEASRKPMDHVSIKLHESLGRETVILDEWLVGNNSLVNDDQEVAIMHIPFSNSQIILRAVKAGRIRQLVEIGSSISGDAVIGTITLEAGREISNGLIVSKPAKASTETDSTASAVKQNIVKTAPGEIPLFTPSTADIPSGFEPTENHESDLEYALKYQQIQSFFNDLSVYDNGVLNDDSLSLPPFDENLYCKLIIEMHRYTLAQISDQNQELVQQKAGLGAMVGSLLGVMTGNIFAPFLGHTYGKQFASPSKRIDEYLPDPNLLFLQDSNSYLSWCMKSMLNPRLRRLILHRQEHANGRVYFRLIPAIVTSDSVLPMQVFKIGIDTYFFRPLSAGIDRNQPNYDAIKLQNRYHHFINEGSISKTGLVVKRAGQDIEPSDQAIWKFEGIDVDYYYVDARKRPGNLF